MGLGRILLKQGELPPPGSAKEQLLLDALETEGEIEIRKLTLLRTLIQDAVYNAMVSVNNQTPYQSNAGKAFNNYIELVMPYHSKAQEKSQEKRKAKLKKELAMRPMKIKPMVYGKGNKRS